jgi:hypothetical protein
MDDTSDDAEIEALFESVSGKPNDDLATTQTGDPRKQKSSMRPVSAMTRRPIMRKKENKQAERVQERKTVSLRPASASVLSTGARDTDKLPQKPSAYSLFRLDPITFVQHKKRTAIPRIMTVSTRSRESWYENVLVNLVMH